MPASTPVIAMTLATSPSMANGASSSPTASAWAQARAGASHPHRGSSGRWLVEVGTRAPGFLRKVGPGAVAGRLA